MRRVLRPLLQIALLALAVISPAQAWADPDPDELVKSGQADRALHLLNVEVRTHPDNAAAYNLLSRVYFQLQQWDPAVRMAEKSVALEPGNSLYHQWLGRAVGRKAENANLFSAFTAFGLARRAKAEFERAVALDGNNLSARSDLTEYYLEAYSFLGGDKSKARAQADAMAAHDPALAQYFYAQVEEKQGSGRAEELYKKAIAASDNAARYWVELAHYYRRAGRLRDMESAIASARTAAHHDGMPAYDGAFLLLRTGHNFPGAIEMLRGYLDGSDLSEDGPAFHAHYLLGELLEKVGDRQRAAEEFRAAQALAPQFRPARDALAHISR